jgi:hypothetical protein
MANSLSQTLSNPWYAAIISALVALVALYIDHKINKTEDKASDYFKFTTFVSILVFGVVWSVVNGGGGRSVATKMGGFAIMNEPF